MRNGSLLSGLSQALMVLMVLLFSFSPVMIAAYFSGQAVPVMFR